VVVFDMVTPWTFIIITIIIIIDERDMTDVSWQWQERWWSSLQLVLTLLYFAIYLLIIHSHSKPKFH